MCIRDRQQSEAWRKALDGVPDSLRMLLEINNIEKMCIRDRNKIDSEGRVLSMG